MARYRSTSAFDSAAQGQPTHRRARIAIVISVALLVAAVIGVYAVRLSPSAATSGCAPGGQLRIAVTPEIAPVLSSVLQVDRAQHPSCRDAISVVPTASADVASQLSRGDGHAPDVWVPDSSLWIHRAGSDAAGSEAPGPVSLASSPLTVAVPAAVARKLRADGPLLVSDLLPTSPGTAGPVRWVLADPRQQASGVGTLLGLKTAVRGHREANGLLATIIQSSRDGATSLADLARGTEPAAVPVSEQQLYDFSAAQPAKTLAAAYPSVDGFRFDYPYLVLSANQQIRDRAQTLLTSLQGDLGRRLFDASGFRSPDGTAGRDLATVVGLPTPSAYAGSVPSATAVSAATDGYVQVTRPSRLLALLDVSGSMKSRVPGAGGVTRIQLAVQAAVNGLAVYPDDTAVGLWVFSTELTPTTDYRELVPLAPLGRGPDGISGRERMARGLAQVTIAKGKSGVYDSLLAAVRDVRDSWDPERVNSVVIITDGANNDPGGVTLDKLLATLEAENDPQRPVAVFGIAYGPSGDLTSLSKISAVTGGKSYAAPDPRQINQVLGDAIGRRTCAPNC